MQFNEVKKTISQYPELPIVKPRDLVGVRFDIESVVVKDMDSEYGRDRTAIVNIMTDDGKAVVFFRQKAIVKFCDEVVGMKECFPITGVTVAARRNKSGQEYLCFEKYEEVLSE